MALQITTWNVNSLRSRVELVDEFLHDVGPDVLVVQETKCGDERFPWKLFADAGYEVAHHGSGGSAGVALASRVGLERVQWGFAGEHGPPFDEPRILSADCDRYRVVTVYVPNGRRLGSAHWHFKLAWFELLAVELGRELGDSESVVVAGDFNVCPTPADLYQPGKRNRNLVSDEERAAVRSILDAGFVDLARLARPDDPGYTWFSFSPDKFEKNLGYRLDLILGSSAIAETLIDCGPDLDWRHPDRRPSDHCPVSARLDPSLRSSTRAAAAHAQFRSGGKATRATS